LGLLSAVVGIFGASKKKKAAGKAAEAQIAALQQGIGAVQQQGALGQARIDEALKAFLPFIEGGTEAFGAQQDLLGLGGTDKQAAAIEALKNSPLFASLVGSGEEGILANASATGGLRGGNIQRGLADFRADTLASVIQDQLTRLGGLSAQGLGAASNSAATQATGANLGADMASTLASLFSGQGAAKAGGILGKANANAEMYGHAAKYAGEAEQAIAQLLTGGGGTIKGFV